jgi:hypothetical protein
MRSVVLLATAFVLGSAAASAQSTSAQLTAGFATSYGRHHTGDESASSPNSVAPSVWAEVSIPVAGLTFHTGIEFSLQPFKMVSIHQGSRGSRADITNRDIVISQLFGARLGGGRAHAIALAGGALVVSRRAEDLLQSQNPNSDGSPRPPVRTLKTETNVNLALAGGLEVPIHITTRVAITPGVRLRVVIPRDCRGYARFSISPGISVQFGL